MNGPKLLNVLLDKQKQTVDKRGTGFKENSKIILLKLNTFGRKFVTCSNDKSILTCFICEGNNHLNYTCPYITTYLKKIKRKWIVKIVHKKC